MLNLALISFPRAPPCSSPPASELPSGVSVGLVHILLHKRRYLKLPIAHREVLKCSSREGKNYSSALGLNQKMLFNNDNAIGVVRFGEVLVNNV